MLVLSRGPNDKIVFPNLGVSVEILRISGNRVKVGVSAPDSVAVLRHELAGAVNHELRADAANHELVTVDAEAEGRRRHELRNQLNTACLALGLAERQINAGRVEQALESLARGVRQLESIDIQQAPAPAPAPVNEAAVETISKRPQRALIVEDDPNERELLAGYLRLSGFEVDTACDGLQAVVHLSRKDRPDMILMDMNMPRMNGARTVESIRRDRAYDGVKVFAVTGEEPGSGGVPVGRNGVDRWFVKPVKPKELVEEMSRELVSV